MGRKLYFRSNHLWSPEKLLKKLKILGSKLHVKSSVKELILTFFIDILTATDYYCRIFFSPIRD